MIDSGKQSTTTPLVTFICKVASRCNLDCDYCYVYRHTDQSWRQQPYRMSLQTAAQLGRRINEHARTHSLEKVSVTLHGGEPFMLSVQYLRQFCMTVVEHAPDLTISWQAQTNGTFYTDEVFEFCREWGIICGLSVDGPWSANDRHRIDLIGRSSFAKVEQSLALLSSTKGRPLWGGILAVIDLENDPLEVYSYFQSFQPPSIEFLMPLGHHDLRPPGKRDSLATTPYADWLLTIFHVWYKQRPQPIRIRRFRDIIALYLGANHSSEEWGLQPVDLIVVESDGQIQAVDTLKVTFPNACNLDLNIYDHSFDDALKSPLVAARQESWKTLSTTCQECNLVRICGGGYYPHRYSREKGFDNPSVYCADLTKMIREITATTARDLRSSVPTTSPHCADEQEK